MCKKKIVFPSFGTAANAQPAQPAQPESISDPVYNARQQDFYGAVFNIISTYFRNSLSIATKDEFDTAFHANDGVFSMYFYLKPSSEIPGELFATPTQAFFQTIWDVAANNELHSIRTSQKGTPDSPIFILRAKSMSDLMELTETLLTPYNMNLLTFSFTHTARNFDKRDGGFQFDILYSLPHVKGLYDAAIGLTYHGQGPHLSH